MEFKQSIPKLKILSLTLLITLFISALFIQPLAVKAATGTVAEGYSADSDVVNSSGAWYSTYAVGAGYKGQGVLVYLIDRQTGAAVPGTTPKAFPCSSAMMSYPLHAQDKFNKYPEVTHWENQYVHWKDSVPDNGGIIRSTTRSNLDRIKDWLTTPYGDGTKGIKMVQEIWGDSIAEAFTQEKYVLVAEVIVANQFSSYWTTDYLDFETASTPTELEENLNQFKTLISLNSRTTAMSTDLQNLVDSTLENFNSIPVNSPIAPTMAQDIRTGFLEKYHNLKVSTKIYQKYGDVYCGTPKKIAAYYASLSSPYYSGGKEMKKAESGTQWYRKAAHASAYIDSNTIVCNPAIPAPNLWPAGASVKKLHTDTNINTKTIGMFAMLAFTTDIGGGQQTTCNEPLIPDTHEAPNESTGNHVIIKSYRIRLNNNVLQDEGTYVRYNVCNEITIEHEDDYRVIGWKESSNPLVNGAGTWTLNSTIWETSIPSHIGQHGTSPTTVTLDSSHRYLYVLLEKSDDGVSNANYTLTQSSITRHINSKEPDAWSAQGVDMVKLYPKSFGWSIEAHSSTCSGHVYYTTCGGTHGCGQNIYCGAPCGDTNGDGVVNSNDNMCGGHACLYYLHL